MQRDFLSLLAVLLSVWTEASSLQCPVSWLYSGGSCFKAVAGNAHNYDSASIACQNEGGRLASIHSPEELQFLRDNLHPSGQLYIGLKRNPQGNWMYNDTSSYDYSSWDKGEPANYDECVVLNPNTFKWSGESCDFRVDGALCRKSLGKHHRCFRCKRQDSGPQVTCTNFIYSVPYNSNGAHVDYKEPTATNYVNVSQTHHPGDFFRVGVTTVTYTFIGTSGNETCSFTVTLESDVFDGTTPTVTCRNFTDPIKLGSLDGEKTVFFEEPNATDNSGQVNLESRSHQPGDFFEEGETKVTYTYVDAAGNNESCSFYVIVQRDQKESLPESEEIRKYLEENRGKLTEATVIQVSGSLADLTSSTSNLTKDDVDDIAVIIDDISRFNSTSPRVTAAVFNITDNIITAEENEESLISESSSRMILQSLERQVENVLRNEQNFNRTGLNIAVTVVQLKDFEERIRFGSLSTENETIEMYDSEGLGDTLLLSDSPETVVSIELDSNAILSAFPQDQETLPLSFIVYASDVLFQDSAAKKSRLEINSLVIAASTTVPIKDLPPESLVVTTFLPKNQSVFGDTQCVFWDHTLYDSLGGWSGEGCHLEEDDSSEFFTCFCNHLTSFAILVNPYGGDGHKATRILTVIGCVISIVCLMLTIAGIAATPKIRNNVTKKIIIHLSLALLGLYIFFLIGVERTELEKGCVIFGALIHFFCLASIAWMSVEATSMYIMFVKVINTNVTHFLLKASVFGWGFPFVVVVISVIVSSESYSNGERCFPHHTSLVFFISVLTFVVLLLVYNLVTFTLVTWKLTYSRKKISSASNTRKETLHRLLNVFLISILLGMSWIFGLFPIKDHTLQIVFSFLFCLFTSPQGLVIFVLFGLRQKEVRNTWKRWLQCHLRDKYNVRSVDLSSHTNQGMIGNKRGMKMPKSDTNTDKNETSNTTVETKGL